MKPNSKKRLTFINEFGKKKESKAYPERWEGYYRNKSVRKFDKTKKLTFADKFRPLLADLRWAAHNPNVTGAAPGSVLTSKSEGWEFGCKIEDHGVFCRRKVFVKAEQAFETIPEKEKDPVINVVMDVMLDSGTPATSIEAIAPDCIMIVQDFVPILLERTETAKGHIKIDDSPLLETGRILH